MERSYQFYSSHQKREPGRGSHNRKWQIESLVTDVPRHFTKKNLNSQNILEAT